MKYVLRNLRTTNYTITTQPFNVTRTLYHSILKQIRPNNITYGLLDSDYGLVIGSANGNVSGYLSVPDEFGCSLDNFEDFVSGNIALIKRGSCTFYEKVEFFFFFFLFLRIRRIEISSSLKIKAYLASLAGASAVIIYDTGPRSSRFSILYGILSQPINLPIIGVNHHLGFYFLFILLILPKTKKVYISTRS